MEFTDGTRQSIVSDTSWKVGEGPIRFNSIYLGEIYDARKEVARLGPARASIDSGWRRPAIADRADRPAACPGATAHRVTETLKAAISPSREPGVFIFDLGQNFAGWAQLEAFRARRDSDCAALRRTAEPGRHAQPHDQRRGQIKGRAQGRREGSFAGDRGRAGPSGNRLAGRHLYRQGDRASRAIRRGSPSTRSATWKSRACRASRRWTRLPACGSMRMSSRVGSFSCSNAAAQPHPGNVRLDVPEQPFQRAVGLPASRAIRLRRRSGRHERGVHDELRHGDFLRQGRARLAAQRPARRHVDRHGALSWASSIAAWPGPWSIPCCSASFTSTTAIGG